MYNDLILPHLNYGIELWGTATLKLKKPLKVLQKRALRFIENKKFREHIGYAFKKHKILNIGDIYEYHMANLMYKAFHKILPQSLQKLYNPSQTNITTRQSNLNLATIRKGTKLFNKKPSVTGPYLWNSLQNTCRSSSSFNHFKYTLKKQIINDYS